MKVIVIDGGFGNTAALANMLKKIGCDVDIIGSGVNKINYEFPIFIPGVGQFDYAVQRLNALSFFPELLSYAKRGEIKVIGICIGMQILFDGSEEGKNSGLGLIPGRIVDLKKLNNKEKVPHVGWEHLDLKAIALNKDLRFYFSHSFYASCDPKYVLATYNSGQLSIPAMVKHGEIYGCQFHPEKSNRNGMILLSKILGIN